MHLESCVFPHKTNHLILEDNLVRQELFRRFFGSRPHEIYDNVEGFMSALEPYQDVENCDATFLVLHLDHDLGGEVYANPDNPNTGSEVARRLAIIGQKGLAPTTIAIIHSHNYVAAERMQQDLLRAGIKAHLMPFEP